MLHCLHKVLSAFINFTLKGENSRKLDLNICNENIALYTGKLSFKCEYPKKKRKNNNRTYNKINNFILLCVYVRYRYKLLIMICFSFQTLQAYLDGAEEVFEERIVALRVALDCYGSLRLQHFRDDSYTPVDTLGHSIFM